VNSGFSLTTEKESQNNGLDCPMNIFRVEDSSFLRAAITQALTRAGHNVTGVGDGRKVLLAACVGLPAIIVLDRMLPASTVWRSCS
jgi:DNA-binding response OmpR family regulator